MEARLLVIDPLAAYVDARLLSDQEVRQALLPVARMAMPEQVIERPLSLLAQLRGYLPGAAEPARG